MSSQIRPKLDYQFSLQRKMELVDAVQEIAMVDNAGGASANEWLSEEYKDILRDQEQIRYLQRTLVVATAAACRTLLCPDLSLADALWPDLICFHHGSHRQQYKNRDKSMQYLSGILTDLFADWNRLQGVDARQKLPALQQLIDAGDMDGVLKAFQEVAHVSRRR